MGPHPSLSSAYLRLPGRRYNFRGVGRLMYYVGFRTGEIDSDYTKYYLYRGFTGPNADSSYASSRTFFAMGDHMNYFIGLDDADFGACGGTADYYVKVSGASYLFGA